MEVVVLHNLHAMVREVRLLGRLTTASVRTNTNITMEAFCRELAGFALLQVWSGKEADRYRMADLGAPFVEAFSSVPLKIHRMDPLALAGRLANMPELTELCL
jgi:hypothetical protein